METLNEYAERMIADGYNAREDFEPIKCWNCESVQLKDGNEIVEELGAHVITEYDKICQNCKQILGHWAYGGWGI